MKDKKWEEISDRLMVIERKLDNFFSEKLKEITPKKPFDYEDAWKSWEAEPEREDSKVGFLNEAILSCTEEDIEKWNKNEIKKRDILAKDVLDNGFKLHYVNEDEAEIKELFASWGLWSLVEDISDDGDGMGDNLQLTKEGLEAHRMIEELLEEKEKRGYEKGREDQANLDGLIYGTTVATSTTLEEGWVLKDGKKLEEELKKLNGVDREEWMSEATGPLPPCTE